jgi:ligand-binding sensor domain-containing protein
MHPPQRTETGAFSLRSLYERVPAFGLGKYASKEVCIVQLKKPVRPRQIHHKTISCSMFPSSRRSFWLTALLGLMIASLGISRASNANAQSISEPHWTVFRQGDGLISDELWSVLSDGDAVWVGSNQGVARYNGRWLNFYNMDSIPPEGGASSGLESGDVVALAASPADGSIWAASLDGYISQWNGETWTSVIRMPTRIYVLLPIKSRLYIGSDVGLWQMDPGNGVLEQIPELGDAPIYAIQPDGDDEWAGGANGLWRHRHGQWSAIDLPETLPSDQINDLWLDSAGALWVASPDGVTWYDPSKDVWSGILLPIRDRNGNSMDVLTLTGDETGAVWAGSDGGGARKFIDYGLVTIDVSRASGGGLTTPLVSDITIDDDGSVWFATPIGLFQYQEKMWFTDFQDVNELNPSLNDINDLLVDRNNTLWIATAGAGVRHKKAVSTGYEEKRFNAASGDLPHDNVYALTEDVEGGIWAGTYEGVARYIHNEWTSPIDDGQLPAPVISTLLADNTLVWIGFEGGLASYDLTSGQVNIIPYFVGANIEALTEDGLGRLWVGTRSKGVWLRDNRGGWRQFVAGGDWRDFPDTGVLANGLAPDPGIRGGMWALAPQTGLLHWDGRRWQEGDPLHKLPAGLLYRAYADKVDGSLWVGNEAGVSHYDGLTGGALNVEDGLQSTAIYAIAQERDGSYWFGGPEGLTRFWPERTPPWVEVSFLDGFTEEEGAQTAVLNQETMMAVDYGDLQTPAGRLDVFYRTDGNATWRELESDEFDFTPQTLGEHSIEFMARDLAFNYSQPDPRTFMVAEPPHITTLPLLGQVEQGIFWTLILLGGTALLGFTYVSFEIVQQRRRVVNAVKRAYNPYVSGDPVRSEEMFFGRQGLVQRIVDTLHNNSIMIHGERRIGKTTLLYQLANVLREVKDPEYWFVPIYVDLEGTPQEEFFHFLIEEIARGLVNLPPYEEKLQPILERLHYHDIAAAEYRDRDFSYDIRTVIIVLQECGEERYPDKHLRIILLLDEMDVMSAYDHVVQQQLRRIFMRDFSSTLGAVVAGIQISKEWDRVESPWFNLFNEVEIKPFTREEGIELLIEPVRDIYSYDAAAIEFILDESDGRPFRIQQYGLESVNHMLADGRRRVKMEDVEAAHARIQSSYTIAHARAGLDVWQECVQKNETMPQKNDNRAVTVFKAGNGKHPQLEQAELFPMNDGIQT